MRPIRPGLVIGVLALVAVPSAASAPTRPGTNCAQWNVAGTWQALQRASAKTPVFHITFRFAQSGTRVTGQAVLTAAEARASGYSGTKGTLTGTMAGSRLNVIVTWPPANGVVGQGHYVASVTSNAITAGRAWPVLQPSLQISWTAAGRARCVRR